MDTVQASPNIAPDDFLGVGGKGCNVGRRSVGGQAGYVLLDFPQPQGHEPLHCSVGAVATSVAVAVGDDARGENPGCQEDFIVDDHN